mmetsp:Transcript_24001/g.62334  ORF Transcript_24001/g.62334 Transcript_24001/m.62334 type:complete len:224 (-) Transcript_24001:865-1536(-)
MADPRLRIQDLPQLCQNRVLQQAAPVAVAVRQHRLHQQPVVRGAPLLGGRQRLALPYRKLPCRLIRGVGELFADEVEQAQALQDVAGLDDAEDHLLADAGRQDARVVGRGQKLQQHLPVPYHMGPVLAGVAPDELRPVKLPLRILGADAKLHEDLHKLGALPPAEAVDARVLVALLLLHGRRLPPAGSRLAPLPPPRAGVVLVPVAVRLVVVAVAAFAGRVEN